MLKITEGEWVETWGSLYYSQIFILETVRKVKRNVLNHVSNISTWIFPHHLRRAKVELITFSTSCSTLICFISVNGIASLAQAQMRKVISVLLQSSQPLPGSTNHFFLQPHTLVPSVTCPQLALYFKSRWTDSLKIHLPIFPVSNTPWRFILIYQPLCQKILLAP